MAGRVGKFRFPRFSASANTMDVHKAEQLREGYNQLANALRATRDAVHRHNAKPGVAQEELPAVRLDAVGALREFIQQECAPTSSPRWLPRGPTTSSRARTARPTPPEVRSSAWTTSGAR